MLLTLKVALGVFLGITGSMILSIALLNSKLYMKLMSKMTENYITNLESTYNK